MKHQVVSYETIHLDVTWIVLTFIWCWDFSLL